MIITPTNLHFHDRLRCLITRHGYSQQSFANILDLRRDQVGKWCRGLGQPNALNLAKMMRVFDGDEIIWLISVLDGE